MKLPRVRIATVMFLVIVAGLVAALVAERRRSERLTHDLVAAQNQAAGALKAYMRSQAQAMQSLERAHRAEATAQILKDSAATVKRPEHERGD